MTTYSRREIVSRRVEYGVESGACIGEFEKVRSIAFADYCQRSGLNPESSIAHSDDWATVEPRDDEVVIAFVFEKRVEDGESR